VTVLDVLVVGLVSDAVRKPKAGMGRRDWTQVMMMMMMMGLLQVGEVEGEMLGVLLEEAPAMMQKGPLLDNVKVWLLKH